jgi:hypothetical protein
MEGKISIRGKNYSLDVPYKMSIKDLLDQIDEIIIKNHPEIEVNEIVHKWSDLYKLFSSNKNLSVRQVIKSKKRFKIGYNMSIEFVYCERLEIVNDFPYLNKLINENVSCRKINKNSRFYSMNSFLVTTIFSFLKVYDLEEISKVNRIFFSLMMKNIFSKKLLTSIKLPYFSSGLQISKNTDDLNVDNLFSTGNYDYIVVKIDSQNGSYELYRVEKGEKSLILSFQCLCKVYLENCFYIFEVNTNNKDLETIMIDNLMIKKIYLNEPIYFIFYHNYSSTELIAVDYTGCIYSINKKKGSISKIFNKKNYEVQLLNHSSLESRVSCYCYKDMLLVYSNRLIVYDLKRHCVHKKLNVSKIEQFNDSLIEEGLLIANLRSQNQIKILDIHSLTFIKTYEKSLLNQEKKFTFFIEKYMFGLGQIINNIMEKKFSDQQQKIISIEGQNLLSFSSKFDFFNRKIFITDCSTKMFTSFTVPQEIKYTEFTKYELYEKFSEHIYYETIKSLDLSIFIFYDINSNKISAKLNYPQEKTFFNKKGKFILISSDNYSLHLYDESFSLKGSIIQEVILFNNFDWKFYDNHLVGVSTNNFIDVYIWNIETNYIKETKFPSHNIVNSYIKFIDKFILLLIKNEQVSLKKFAIVNDDISLIESIIFPAFDIFNVFIDILDNSDVLISQPNSYSIYRKKGENYENIIKKDTLNYFRCKMKEGLYLLEGYNCVFDIRIHD